MLTVLQKLILHCHILISCCPSAPLLPSPFCNSYRCLSLLAVLPRYICFENIAAHLVTYVLKTNLTLEYTVYFHLPDLLYREQKQSKSLFFHVYKVLTFLVKVWHFEPCTIVLTMNRIRNNMIYLITTPN